MLRSVALERGTGKELVAMQRAPQEMLLGSADLLPKAAVASQCELRRQLLLLGVDLVWHNM